MAVGKGSMERAAKTAAKTAEVKPAAKPVEAKSVAAKPAVAKSAATKPAAAKTKTAAPKTAEAKSAASVKSTVIAKPVEEVLVKSVMKQKKNVSAQNEESNSSVQVGDEMPIYYY